MNEHGRTINVDGTMIGTHSVRAMWKYIEQLEFERDSWKMTAEQACRLAESYKEQLAEWREANGPGGWIDNWRQAELKRLEKKNDI